MDMDTPIHNTSPPPSFVSFCIKRGVCFIFIKRGVFLCLDVHTTSWRSKATPSTHQQERSSSQRCHTTHSRLRMHVFFGNTRNKVSHPPHCFCTSMTHTRTQCICLSHNSTSAVRDAITVSIYMDPTTGRLMMSHTLRKGLPIVGPVVSNTRSYTRRSVWTYHGSHCTYVTHLVTSTCVCVNESTWTSCLTTSLFLTGDGET